MDVDTIEEIQPQDGTSSSKVHRPMFLPVDEAHPFDLDSYIANYSGRTAIDRLVFIIVLCPSIAPEAFSLCVKRIHRSRDPSLYQHLLQAYEQTANAAASDGGLDISLPNTMDLAELDTKWVDDVTAENQADRVKLEVELKTYSNNMIKESIRMAHRDLGNFYRSIGDFGTALKHYTKSREFCTTSHHVLDMCMSILELLIEQRNYAHITTYVFKADAALDAATAASASATAATANSSGNPAAIAQAMKKTGGKNERDAVQAKLDFATALSHLGQGSYEKAANAFLKVGPAKDLGHWIGQLIAPGDIAIYGTLCALATFPRSTIKARVLENVTFSAYIEQEPYIRELIEAYMNSNFKTVLELLNRYSTRHGIDIHLSPHINDLATAIRNRALVLYFQPFATIKLERMSAAFGWTVEEVEQHVVNLIQAGDIQGRVDSQNKILKAKKTDYRDELFARAIKAGTDMQAANRKLLLRMRLQQADLIVKPPKGANQSGVLTDFYAGGE
ncbi:COP9 signalosome complex subunit 1 [Psilocybe cubensis]|uniref:COP9 signalosome complex subunit 1 n=2 Tax=Psilocybe cubensis TaxID=181762 RepID=A0ACB8GGF7_PSICU|nr:COP9 signalosome complex subunit 1 [Psilocybe cubensis]KAH9474510.1 COP9 signalosome complex subunit 1 [Psilocybe cubensis]